jgi:transposase-like protein
MRLQLILPRVEPNLFQVPSVCPVEGCQGKHFEHHQEVIKPLKDTKLETVIAHRYRCLRCNGTFRVYPQGVTRAQTSQRVTGLAVLLYLLGLSYGAVSLALEALGVYMAKSSVYEAVQAAAKKVPGLKRQEVFTGIRTPAVGGDLTSVKCNGEWLHLGLAVDDITGLVLTVDELEAEDAETLQEWLEPIVKAVGAQLLVTDDADAFKVAADNLGQEHQICKSHVKRNTETLIDNLEPKAAVDDDGSLAEIDVTPEEASKDLERLGELILSRQPDEEKELEEMHQRYIDAAPPRPGEKATIAYRLRLLFLDRWNLWRDLTRYREWTGPDGETIDGTNNGCERAIGWWVKERYRTMRGYKRPESAVNVSRLLAWSGNHLNKGGADLALLIA